MNQQQMIATTPPAARISTFDRPSPLPGGFFTVPADGNDTQVAIEIVTTWYQAVTLVAVIGVQVAIRAGWLTVPEDGAPPRPAAVRDLRLSVAFSSETEDGKRLDDYPAVAAFVRDAAGVSCTRLGQPYSIGSPYHGVLRAEFRNLDPRLLTMVNGLRALQKKDDVRITGQNLPVRITDGMLLIDIVPLAEQFRFALDGQEPA